MQRVVCLNLVRHPSRLRITDVFLLGTAKRLPGSTQFLQQALLQRPALQRPVWLLPVLLQLFWLLAFSLLPFSLLASWQPPF
jgi:hypothetical protein